MKELKYSKIKGGIFTDDRGILRYANDFKLTKFKRFYQITLPRKKMIRAFHGHMKESKAIFPISGSILVCLAPLDNTKNPSTKTIVKKIVLDANKPYLLEIPPKCANGIMSLEKNSSIIFFSNKTVEESKKDDYRFAPDYWGEKVWKVE